MMQHVAKEEKNIPKAIPEQLELISTVLADVGGYLEYLLSIGALHPRHVLRTEQHERRVGEAWQAVMEVKRQLGLPVEGEEEEREEAA